VTGAGAIVPHARRARVAPHHGPSRERLWAPWGARTRHAGAARHHARHGHAPWVMSSRCHRHCSQAPEGRCAASRRAPLPNGSDRGASAPRRRRGCLAAFELGLRLAQEERPPVVAHSRTGRRGADLRSAPARPERGGVPSPRPGHPVPGPARGAGDPRILNSSLVHPREVFRPAIAEAAAGSSSSTTTRVVTQPFRRGPAVTRQLVAAGQLLDLPVYDHIIPGGRPVVSFSQGGLL
jgi:hypothetical protein